MIQEEEIQKSFLHFYQQKRYAQALLFASKYPFLQQLPEYESLHQHFIARLNLAAKYIQKGNEEKAKTIIAEFSRLDDKRHMIALLLQYKERFLRFVHYVTYGEVEEAYKIATEDKRYEKLALYEELILKIERVLARIDEALENLDFSVEPMVEMMQFYPKTKLLKKKLELLKRFYDLYEQKDLKECYAMMEKEKILQTNSLAKKLQEKWYEALFSAEAAALRGDVEHVVASFREFLQIPSKQKNIAIILKKASRKEIELLLEAKEEREAEQKIYRYLELFGKDALFGELMERFEKQTQKKLAIVLQYQKQEDRWIYKL